MKIKKFASALLAAVMVFALTCTPAFAAKADTLAKINDDDSIWVGVKNLGDLEKEITIKVRNWSSSDGTIRLGEVSEPDTWVVYELPLGVTLAAGPNNGFLDNVWVYSDPDGDGVYHDRMEKNVYDDDGKFVSSEFIPADATGPFTSSDNEIYSNTFDWGFGSDYIVSGLKGTPGYHTATTDYLVEQFGANSLVIFWDEEEEYYYGFLLTGKPAPAGVLSPLGDQGIAVTVRGDVVSPWALEAVHDAMDASLLNNKIRLDHNYDLTGQITRAQFACMAADLYCTMSGKDTITYTDSAVFTDVSKDHPYYEDIMAAYALKVVNGKGNDRFAPNDLVTRQEAATMLSRVYTALGGKIPAVGNTTFADNADVAAYAKDAVAFMSAHSIINGVGNNRFNPKGNASVEQALKIAVEMLNNLDV